MNRPAYGGQLGWSLTFDTATASDCPTSPDSRVSAPAASPTAGGGGEPFTTQRKD
jgi:hypothetical protein